MLLCRTMDFPILPAPNGRIYLDHNASTPLAKEVGDFVLKNLSVWGNASSIHWAGRGPKAMIREARRKLAQALNVSPLELVFTSGGSESNNTVLQGLFDYVTSMRVNGECPSAQDRPLFRIIVSEVEHPSLLKTAEALKRRGAKLDFVKVNRSGQIDIDMYQRLLEEPTDLVSIMAANNETGTIFPVAKLASMARKKGAFFHTDAVQILGKTPLDLKTWGVDYASFSAHKFYSLKGAGLIYFRKGAPQWPLLYGGNQERGRRAGTENALAIGSFGQMAQELAKVGTYHEKLNQLRDHMEARIAAEIPKVTFTGAESPRVPNTSSMVIDEVDGESLLMALDVKGFAVSTGAACSSGSPEPSPVLRAMGLSHYEAQSSLRVSLGWENSQEEIDHFVDTLKETVQRLRLLRREERV